MDAIVSAAVSVAATVGVGVGIDYLRAKKRESMDVYVLEWLLRRYKGRSIYVEPLMPSAEIRVSSK